MLIMNRTTGLNNKQDAKRLRMSDGTVELSAANNVLVTNDGAIERRQGYSQVAEGSFRDLHRNGQDFFAVKDGQLVKFTQAADVFTGLASAGSSPVFYANVGQATYISSATLKQIYSESALHDWEVATYTGPDTGQSFSGPPANGTIICYDRGVMYVVEDNILWHSEPYHPNLFNLAKGFIPFKSNIVEVAAVGNTLYVSDEYGVYAHVGGSPADFTQRRVHDAPMITGTVSRTTKQVLEGNREGLFVTTDNGICYATSDGVFINLTEHQLNIDHATTGCSFMLDDHYVSIGD